MIFDEVHGLGHDFVGVTRVGGDVGEREGGALPRVLVVDLRYRDLEARPHPLLEPPEDVALALQRIHVRQVQLHHPQRHARGHGPSRAARYSVRATSSVENTSSTSPAWIPGTASTPIPHSWPFGTSRTSSLKRLSEVTTPWPMTSSPRRTRTLAPRTILPSDTYEPAMGPSFEITKICRT